MWNISILYSGKFSRGPIFGVIANDCLIAKIKYKLDCTVYNGHEYAHLRNGRDRPTMITELRKNSLLYGGIYTHTRLVHIHMYTHKIVSQSCTNNLQVDQTKNMPYVLPLYWQKMGN